jgi:oligoribonuclease
MNKELLLWIDLETTGLDPEKCEILELAVILSDFSTKNLYFQYEFQIHYDLNNLKLDNWCKIQHEKSGLLSKVEKSKLSLNWVEDFILNELSIIINNETKIYISGNSVHFDKSFIKIHMKKLYNILSHRILDVSSLAIVYKNLNIEYYNKAPVKKYKHTALDDIIESINEYRHYIKFIKEIPYNMMP